MNGVRGYIEKLDWLKRYDSQWAGSDLPAVLLSVVAGQAVSRGSIVAAGAATATAAAAVTVCRGGQWLLCVSSWGVANTVPLFTYKNKAGFTYCPAALLLQKSWLSTMKSDFTEITLIVLGICITWPHAIQIFFARWHCYAIGVFKKKMYKAYTRILNWKCIFLYFCIGLTFLWMCRCVEECERPLAAGWCFALSAFPPWLVGLHVCWTACRIWHVPEYLCKQKKKGGKKLLRNTEEQI